MKKFPVYFNRTQQEAMLKLLEEIGEAAKQQNQGTCTIHRDFFHRIVEIQPQIVRVGCNYYDCEGRIAFAIKISGRLSEFIKFDGIVCKGFVFGAPRGHLAKYYGVRW